MTADRIAACWAWSCWRRLLVGCAEQPLETSDPVGLERHIFAVRSDGGGEGVKLDQELLLEGEQGGAS